ncbi:phosphoribosyl pyrophosphate synthase-associated protein 2-like isoform X2 [Oncorhynchus kisutch]|uniref:phosphoribosyl pyrophosphate synthase-associated protein 2-like isoform X2 n=1 Tax=Oncorhynchus kisutch TaxID=8019 RepID=UPI0012DF9F38|nr:phosphoribosyl pyrophosphate synthase-associated protein 2-like isoform X2 [Oncorhynchus kisutch]
MEKRVSRSRSRSEGKTSTSSRPSHRQFIQGYTWCTQDVNRCLMELCVMAYGCVTACARSVCGVLPYLPYSKQCKMRKRGSIVCKLIASLMCRAGLTHLITVDLHQKEIQGFFNIPVDNLRASPFLLQYIQEEIPDYHNAVIVAKSPSSAKRAQSLAERLRVSIAVIHGDAETDLLDGRHSPPTVRTTGGLPELPCGGNQHDSPLVPEAPVL